VRIAAAQRADEYRLALLSEPGLTRAALARRLGVSRAWVTRVVGRYV
jgi:transcriptional regulator with XRE-family HTH domain